MNLEQMRGDVTQIVQDRGYSPVQIDQYINQAVLRVAELVAVPNLKQVDTVSTVVGQRSVSLASVSGGFSGKLQLVTSDTLDTVPQYVDLETMLSSTKSTDVGTVEAVVLVGNTLWYHPVPEAAQELTLVYYSNPPTLVDDTDVPDWLPESLHRKLLVYGACYFMFEEIEDGIEGAKVNTVHYFYHSLNSEARAPVKSGIQNLHEYLGDRRNHCITSVWSV